MAKKIVVWGTGRRAAMYRKWFENYYNVKAYIRTNNISGEIYGTKIIEPLDVINYEFDYVVFVTERIDIESEQAIIKEIDSNILSKCRTIDELTEETKTVAYLSFTSQRQLKVISDLLSASDTEIKDYNWMYSKVIEYGIFCFDEEHWNDLVPEFNWAVYGLQQVPEEFARFCNMISDLYVETAAEVGVYRGRSAFFVCAILARKNPFLKYTMIDICDRIDDFDEFKKVLPQLEKCIPSTSDDYKGKAYDFVFIDADHSYDASINDFNNIGVNARKLVAFHDIYAHEYDHENGGTVRMWQEVMERTKDKEHLIYSIYPDKWMGIGCVKMGE